jgi:hypothetical protein
MLGMGYVGLMTEDFRVSVDRAGLDAFIVYANDLRHALNAMAPITSEERRASVRQFDLMVAGLDRV